MNSAPRKDWIRQPLAETAARLALCQTCALTTNTKAGLSLSGREAIHNTLDEILGVLFPGCHGVEPLPIDDMAAFVEDQLRSIAVTLRQQIERAYQYQCAFDK